jgi:hypothetical protein
LISGIRSFHRTPLSFRCLPSAAGIEARSGEGSQHRQQFRRASHEIVRALRRGSASRRDGYCDARQMVTGLSIVIGPWIAETQAQKVATRAEIRSATGQRRMTRDEIAAIVAALGDLVKVIRDADPADKATRQPGRSPRR